MRMEDGKAYYKILIIRICTNKDVPWHRKWLLNVTSITNLAVKNYRNGLAKFILRMKSTTLNPQIVGRPRI